MNGRIDFFVENRLREAFAVAQVDENHAAVVAPGIDPSTQGDGLIELGGADQAAVVGTHGIGYR